MMTHYQTDGMLPTSLMGFLIVVALGGETSTLLLQWVNPSKFYGNVAPSFTYSITRESVDFFYNNSTGLLDQFVGQRLLHSTEM